MIQYIMVYYTAMVYAQGSTGIYVGYLCRIFIGRALVLLPYKNKY